MHFLYKRTSNISKKEYLLTSEGIIIIYFLCCQILEFVTTTPESD